MTQRMGYTFREEFDIWLYNRDDIRKREQRRGGELIMMYDYIIRYGGDDREIKIEMIDYIEEMMRKATNRFKREYNRYMTERMIEEGERGIMEFMLYMMVEIASYRRYKKREIERREREEDEIGLKVIEIRPIISMTVGRIEEKEREIKEVM